MSVLLAETCAVESSVTSWESIVCRVLATDDVVWLVPLALFGRSVS
jgi:hypothetical protein